jgi:hypothetical protein
MNREAIFSALFALASGAPGLVTTGRKLRHWSDVSASEMPALFQAQGDQVAIRETRFPTKWLMSAKLYVYVSTEAAASPGEVLNPILDYLTAQLADPFPGVPQTLGGLVEYARIEGTVETSEGTLGNVEVAVVPVMILAPT